MLESMDVIYKNFLQLDKIKTHLNKSLTSRSEFRYTYLGLYMIFSLVNIAKKVEFTFHLAIRKIFAYMQIRIDRP